MTDEEYAGYRLATDPLRPVAAIGHFAGMDGMAAGMATLVVFAASSFANAPEAVSYSLALAAAYLAGRSFGRDKWRRYEAACEAEIAAIRKRQ